MRLQNPMRNRKVHWNRNRCEMPVEYAVRVQQHEMKDNSVCSAHVLVAETVKSCSQTALEPLRNRSVTNALWLQSNTGIRN